MRKNPVSRWTVTNIICACIVSSVFVTFDLANAASYRLSVFASVASIREAKFLTDDPFPQFEDTLVPESSFFQGRDISIGDSMNILFDYSDTATQKTAVDGGTGVIHDGVTRRVRVSISGFNLPDALPESDRRDSISVYDRQGDFDSVFFSRWFSEGDWFATFNLFYLDSTGMALSSREIPGPDSSIFLGTTLMSIGFVNRQTRNQMTIDADVRSTRVSVVPLPPALVLLGGSISVAAVCLKRRRSGWNDEGS